MGMDYLIPIGEGYYPGGWRNVLGQGGCKGVAIPKMDNSAGKTEMLEGETASSEGIGHEEKKRNAEELTRFELFQVGGETLRGLTRCYHDGERNREEPRPNSKVKK